MSVLRLLASHSGSPRVNPRGGIITLNFRHRAYKSYKRSSQTSSSVSSPNPPKPTCSRTQVNPTATKLQRRVHGAPPLAQAHGARRVLGALAHGAARRVRLGRVVVAGAAPGREAPWVRGARLRILVRLPRGTRVDGGVREWLRGGGVRHSSRTAGMSARLLWMYVLLLLCSCIDYPLHFCWLRDKANRLCQQVL